MKHYFRKTATLLSACMIALSGNHMVHADVTEVTQNDTGTAQTTVTAAIADEFSVKIPKTIAFDEANNTYSIEASGNISSGKQLVVTCSDTVTLTNSDDGQYTCSVTMDDADLVWSDTTLTGTYTSKSGSIGFDATGVKAGNYTGTAEFTIELK